MDHMETRPLSERLINVFRARLDAYKIYRCDRNLFLYKIIGMIISTHEKNQSIGLRYLISILL